MFCSINCVESQCSDVNVRSQRLHFVDCGSVCWWLVLHTDYDRFQRSLNGFGSVGLNQRKGEPIINVIDSFIMHSKPKNVGQKCYLIQIWCIKSSQNLCWHGRGVMLHHYDVVRIDCPQHLGGFLLEFVLPGNKNEFSLETGESLRTYFYKEK